MWKGWAISFRHLLRKCLRGLAWTQRPYQDFSGMKPLGALGSCETGTQWSWDQHSHLKSTSWSTILSRWGREQCQPRDPKPWWDICTGTQLLEYREREVTSVSWSSPDEEQLLVRCYFDWEKGKCFLSYLKDLRKWKPDKKGLLPPITISSSSSYCHTVGNAPISDRYGNFICLWIAKWKMFTWP